MPLSWAGNFRQVRVVCIGAALRPSRPSPSARRFFAAIRQIPVVWPVSVARAGLFQLNPMILNWGRKPEILDTSFFAMPTANDAFWRLQWG